MREEAMSLIATSARKLADLLSFSRIAFGGSTASETFDVRDLEQLTRGLFEHVRGQIDWAIEPAALNKASARTLLNLAQLGATALPMGGTARLSVREEPGLIRLELDAKGPRARLRPEAVDGLEARPFSEGLGGQWVQTYFLRSIVDQAGGTMSFETLEDAVRVHVELPGE